jgi:endonuclease-3
MNPINLSIKQIEKVFSVFSINYKTIPLEVFGTDPYQTLISTLLSSRTKDEVTLRVCVKLFSTAKNVKQLNRMSEHDLQLLIYPVGFYNTKAKHLKLLSEILIKEYNSQIPKTREELMSLPGVGRKTANLVLNRTFGFPAIAVDTHVHRISNLLGWVDTSDPEKTEVELMKVIPKKFWRDMNRLFVSIGKQYTSKKQLKNFLSDNKLIDYS